MKKFGFLLLALLASAAASAATVTVTWTNPTQYVDNTTLPASAITRTRIEYGSCSGNNFGTKAGEFVVTGNAATGTSPNLSPGTYCFRAYTTASGVESDASAVARRTIEQPAPKPPANFTTTSQTAYTSVKQRDRLVLLPVGTVAPGTACISQEAVIAGGVTYHAVPRESVSFSASVRPEVVYGLCG